MIECSALVWMEEGGRDASKMEVCKKSHKFGKRGKKRDVNVMWG